MEPNTNDTNRYSKEEIAEMEKKGHKIGAPHQKLHADEDDGAKKTTATTKKKTNAAGIVEDEA